MNDGGEQTARFREYKQQASIILYRAIFLFNPITLRILYKITSIFIFHTILSYVTSRRNLVILITGEAVVSSIFGA